LELRRAQEKGDPFSIATIDMQFKVGERGTQSPRGKEILRTIKSEYPYVACIMISGSSVSGHEVLDLRDNYDLDYFISKDRLDEEMLKRAIARAMERVRPLGSSERRLEVLNKTLEIYKDTCIQYARNLAQVEKKKAQQGIDVGVGVENQIEGYKAMLEKIKERIRETEQDIRRLEDS
jgi:hypothetical protein